MSNKVFEQAVLIVDPQSMHALGQKIGEQLKRADLVILTGELGAGKTTLSRGIGEGLQVRGPVTSPTFVLARTHPSLVGGPNLIHVDAYRVTDAAEFDDLDLDYDSSVVLVEWGANKVQRPESYLEIEIERDAAFDHGLETDFDFAEETEEPRRLVIKGYGERWREGLQLLAG